MNKEVDIRVEKALDMLEAKFDELTEEKQIELMETMSDFDPVDMVDKVMHAVGEEYTQEELEKMTKNESQKLEAKMQDMLELKM